MSPWPDIPDRYVAIVGSVKLSKDQLKCAQQLIYFILSYEAAQQQGPGEIVVVSGGAEGIDTLAEETAEKWVFDTKIFRPEKKGWYWYKKRNKLIAERCDVLYRIATRESKTYGSGWTADYAEEELGKQVYRFWV